jgi:cell division protein DivIC
MVLNFFKNRKLLLLNLFLVMYVIINLIGGERGLISYFEKKNIERTLIQKYSKNINQLSIVENKNKLLSKNIDLDYLDILYRDKLKYGKKEEILIKLK